MARIISNPPFDSRISTLVGLKPVKNGPNVVEGPNALGIARGSIIQDAALGNVRFAVNFLYNPSIVQVSHQTDVTSSASVTPQAYRNPLDKGDWNIPLSASLSFNLLFDRTYEMWGGGETRNYGDYTGQTPQKVGVRTDVDALYRVVGVLQPKATMAPTTNPSANSPSYLYSNGTPGPMPLTPVTVYFGGPTSLNYRGYVSSIDVQWTHFSQMMIPMRCTVGVSMNLMTQNSWDSDYGEIGAESEEAE